MPAKLKSAITPAPSIEMQPLLDAPSVGATSTEPLENPAAPGQRQEIREISRRVMGSRQSGRKIERSRSRRQPKRGHGSQHSKGE